MSGKSSRPSQIIDTCRSHSTGGVQLLQPFLHAETIQKTSTKMHVSVVSQVRRVVSCSATSFWVCDAAAAVPGRRNALQAFAVISISSKHFYLVETSKLTFPANIPAEGGERVWTARTQAVSCVSSTILVQVCVVEQSALRDGDTVVSKS